MSEPVQTSGVNGKGAADVLAGEGTTPKPVRKTNRKVLWIVGSLALFVILALGLGIGLGVGLKKHSSNALSPAQASGAASPSATSGPVVPIPSTQPEWRLPQSEYHLGMDWDVTAAPTTRVFNFTVGEIQAAPDGVLRTMIVINGQFPSPLIRANRGDRLLINVTNELTEPTSIHWHGLFQNGTSWMDGTSGITQCPIPPGRSFLYNFTVENQYGTYWYHSHYSTQYIDGMIGPLVIHAPEEVEERKAYDFDQVVLLQDWYHDMSADLLPDYLASGNENNEPTPDNALVQGTNTFDCSSYTPSDNRTCSTNSTKAVFTVEKGSRYRYRVINAGAFAEFELSVDNHTLSVIETDGTSVEPTEIHRLTINVAQRYSVILTANQPSTNYNIRATMLTNCFAVDNPILNPFALATLTYTNTATDPTSESVDWADALMQECRDLDYTTLVPTAVRAAPKADVLYEFGVSFQIKAYALDRGYFNDTTWSPATTPTLNQAVSGLANKSAVTGFSTAGVSTGFSANQLVVSVPTRQVVDLLIQNFDDGAHPFHLHGHEFWLMAQSNPPYTTGYFPWDTYDSLNTTNPVRRDTLTLPAYGWALIRFEADHAGLWAFHCHIAWHMEAGLLMQFMTRVDELERTTLPADVAGLCDV